MDQTLGPRLVVDGGEIIDIDDDRKLLWAIRMAGVGNFGAVVELRVKLYPVPKFYFGLLSFNLFEAASIFEKLHM